MKGLISIGTVSCVTVLSHRGQFNKELEEYCNAWPSRLVFHKHHHHHHHHVSSHQYTRKVSMLSNNTFCLVQPLWLLPSSWTPLCFTLSQMSVTWGLLFKIAFGGDYNCWGLECKRAQRSVVWGRPVSMKKWQHEPKKYHLVRANYTQLGEMWNKTRLTVTKIMDKKQGTAKLF